MYKIFLAWRYLISRKIIFLAVGGIAVGVMALIVVTSVMGGFSREMKDRIRGTSAHLNITPADTYFIYNSSKIIERIKNVPEVIGCAPRLEWGALFGTGLTFVQVIGIEPRLEKQVNNYEKYLLRGTPLEFPDKKENNLPPAIVGNQLFLSSDINVSLTSLKLTSGIPLPIRQEFKVIGAFSTGMFEYDNNIYIPLKTAQDFLGVPNGVTKICVAIKDYQNINIVKEEIRQLLAPIGSFHINTWEEEKRILLRAVSTEKNINAFLLFFIVVVAAFNILALLTMRVVEKTKDIGVLISLGGKPSGIMWLFVWQGLLISFIGAVLGVISGYLIAYYLNAIEDAIYHISQYIIYFHTYHLMISIAILLFLGLSVFIVIYWIIYALSKKSMSKFIMVLSCIVILTWITLLIVYSFSDLLSINPHKLPAGWKLFPPDVYYLDKIPSEINYLTIIIIVIATLSVGIIFSIYPAIKAARLNPVDALRYE
ncbi:MAG: ABC transporter permease [Planctomycetota bacterium]